MAQMSSSRPYLVRALYEWILENDCTPYVLVNAQYPQTSVPDAFVEAGQIVLNLSPNAIRHLEMDNDRITFDGRFGGVAQQVWVPAQAVMAIYARENGQGMVFEVEPAPVPPSDDPEADKSASVSSIKAEKAKRPSLKVVK
ncbi:stringent starvation protein B [Halopseudomonas salina]|uniref:Stringent starvation protein B n=2 Tax=Halopseudomonas salina TaxID=1323744 RepID=A0ABQ1PW83_9GAMM|nr:stringent starvation protein B [Halopseudomonas salina]